MLEQCPSLQVMMPVRPRHSLLLLQLYRFRVSGFAWKRRHGLRERLLLFSLLFITRYEVEILRKTFNRNTRKKTTPIQKDR